VRQRAVEWCSLVRSSTLAFLLVGLELECDWQLEVEGYELVHGELTAV
jgi:hypothetical protein